MQSPRPVAGGEGAALTQCIYSGDLAGMYEPVFNCMGLQPNLDKEGTAFSCFSEPRSGVGDGND